MLKITDKEGHVRWVLNDEDEEPRSIDDIVLNGTKEELEEDEAQKTKEVN